MKGMKTRAVRGAALALALAGAVQAGAQQAVEAVSQQPSFGTDARSRAKIHTELASMYFQEGNMAVALEELGIALQADSGYAPAYNVRGLVHAYLREQAEAEDDFRKAINLAPNDPEVNNNYGWFLCQSGKERQSIAFFLNAVKNPLYSTPDRAYANAGSCALKAGDLQGAEHYLQQALRLSRDGGDAARVQLATVNYRLGKFDEARQQVGLSLRGMTQPSADALWLALRIERKLGNRQAESGFAAQLRSRYPASPEYQEFLKGNFE